MIAVLACAALAAAWMVPTLGTLAAGMDRADSLWYHMPLAARFVQTGYLGHIEFFDPIFLASFYPANSEVLHARPDPVLRTATASRPLLNLGWLSMALLAAWCIGRPYGLGAAGADRRLGGARLAEPGRVPGRRGAQRHHRRRLRPRRRGAAGQRVRGGRRGARPRTVTGRAIAPAALAVAGIAAGLAAGTKLSFLAPVAALTVAVIVIAPRTTRLRAAALWGIPMLAAGGYWYVAQPDRGRQPDPLHRLAGPDLAAGPGSRLPASARLRRRPLLERHGRVAALVRARARTTRSGPSGR